MAELRGTSVQARRFVLALLGGFAALAVALAAAGVFGLLSFVTTQRTREYGVRLALGAARGTLVGGVLRRGLTLATAGTALGLFGALVLTRFLAGMLYEVGTTDPATFVAAALTLGTAAALAALLPALRVARTNPADVLHGE